VVEKARSRMIRLPQLDLALVVRLPQIAPVEPAQGFAAE